MKLSLVTIFATLASSAAFTSTSSAPRTTSLNAESQSRKAFLGAAAAAVFGVAAPAFAGTMDQENVSDPTEVWETGKPSAEAKAARVARYQYTNARTQMNSNFAPQKRLTLERKSPVTRLDINSPNFEAYKTTLPGLYKKP